MEDYSYIHKILITKRIKTILLSYLLLSCSQSYESQNAIVVADTTSISVDTVLTSDVNTFSNQFLDVQKLSRKKFFSGTVHELFFENDKNISITFERYYDGRCDKYKISGKFSIPIGDKIKIECNDTNTISWLNTWGECGLQTVNQSESFSDILSFNNSSNCVSVNTIFRQSFYAGNRCGNETKNQNNTYEFYLN